MAISRSVLYTILVSATVVLIVLFSACSKSVQRFEHTGLSDAEPPISIVTPNPDLSCSELKDACATELQELSVKKLHGGYEWTLIYLPKELEACRSGMDGALVVDALRTTSEMNSTDQYVLQINALADGGDFDLNSFLQYGIERRIRAVIGRDTVPCGFAHVESGPANSPLIRVIMGFDVLPNSADRTILISGEENSVNSGVLVLDYPHGLFEQYVELVQKQID